MGLDNESGAAADHKMITWLPFVDFKDSAWILSDSHLKEQRWDAKRIILTLEGHIPNKDWRTLPEVRMWEDYPEVLALYGFVACTEWCRRHGRCNVRSFFALRVPKHDFEVPEWLGDEEIHLSHQSNLIAQQPERYSRVWPEVPGHLNLVFP